MSFRYLTSAGVAFGVVLSAPGFAQERSPLYEFLKAADEGRTSDMISLISKSGISAGQFLKKIEKCYLRRVYGAPEGQVLAAWMCDEGPGKSRVLIADVSEAGDGVRITVGREMKNSVPAPARTGPALAEDDNG